MGPHRILPMPQQAYWSSNYQKAGFPISSPPLTTPYAHTGPGAACHPGGLASTIAESLMPQGLSLPWPACPLVGLPPWSRNKHCQHLGKGLSPEKLEQAWQGHEKICCILRKTSQVGLPWGRASWVHSGPASCSSPWRVLLSKRTSAQLQDSPQLRKARTSVAGP